MWTKKFIALFAIQFLMQLSLQLTSPIVSSYAVAIGASVSLAGIVAGALSASALLLRPFSGAVADLFRRKTLLIIALSLYIAVSFGSAFIPNVIALCIFRIFQGAAFSFGSTIVISLAPEVVPKERIGSAVGCMGACNSLGIALGPLAGTTLSEKIGYPSAFIAAGMLFLFALLLVFNTSFSEEDKNYQNQRSNNTIARQIITSHILYKPVLWNALIAGIMSATHGITISLIVLAERIDFIQGATLYFVVFAVVTVFSRPIAGKLTDEKGVKAVVIPSIILSAFAMFLIATLGNYPIVIGISAFFMGLGSATSNAALQAHAMKHAPEIARGRASATYFMGPDLGMGLAPMLGGLIMQEFGARIMFYSNAMLCVIALLLFIVFKRHFEDQ